MHINTIRAFMMKSRLRSKIENAICSPDIVSGLFFTALKIKPSINCNKPHYVIQ